MDTVGVERARASDLPPARTWLGPVVVAVARRPWLWGSAIRQVVVLAPNGWWRHRPWLPVPDRAYLRFRLVTQYGDAGHAPEPDDMVAYLRWCRSYRAATRSH